MVAQLGDFDPQALANTVWAWATLQYQPGLPVLRAVEDAAVQLSPALDAIHWPQLAWGLASLGHRGSSVWRGAEAACRDAMVPHLNAKQLAVVDKWLGDSAGDV